MNDEEIRVIRQRLGRVRRHAAENRLDDVSYLCADMDRLLAENGQRLVENVQLLDLMRQMARTMDSLKYLNKMYRQYLGEISD